MDPAKDPSAGKVDNQCLKDDMENADHDTEVDEASQDINSEYVTISKDNLPEKETENGRTSCDVKSESENKKNIENPYIISIDIGTTSLRSHIYDKNGNIKGSSSKRVSEICFASFQMVIHVFKHKKMGG